MRTEPWRVLVLGDIPEMAQIFEREQFSGDMEAVAIDIEEPYVTEDVVASPGVDLIVLEAQSRGLGLLEAVRETIPSCPTLMVAGEDQYDLILEAKKLGLDNYVVRRSEADLTADLLALELESMLEVLLEPPETIAPSAVQLYRYAQFYNVLHPFFVIDQQGILRYYNNAAIEHFQSLHETRPEIGMRAGEWSLEEDASEFDERLQRALAGEEVVTRRVYEGEEFREIYYQPVEDNRRRVIAVTVAVYEPAHPELEQARRLQSVGRLAAGVAHDVNNVLNVVTTYTSLIRRTGGLSGAEWKTVTEHLDAIERAVERGARLTSQLLTYSGRSRREIEVVDINRVVRDNCEFLGRTIGEDIAVEVTLDDDVPTIQADPSGILEALVNLAINARDAMPTGGELSLSTRRVVVDREGRPPVEGLDEGVYAMLEVRDTGVGIEPEVRDRIFDAFFTTKREKGTGLGLASVKSVVENSGGVIDVDSEPGEGTSFYLYFPSFVRTGVDEGAEERSTLPDVDAADRIMLVEDEPALRESFELLLEAEGYQVISGEDAESALEHADALSAPIDLLVTDVVLPGKDGIELSDELIERWPDMQTIFMSGYADDVVRRYGDMDDDDRVFLSKPVDIDALQETIEELIGKPDSSG